ncbi:DUF1361 domain-containing protein [Paenibacillus sp. YPG26]|uniref:DUF1361 domain-containing protein n=1 Tax=Paenibacillus sp. YPG26 TaxID=2878915 RepID=UPI002040C7AB|nr:DUF1361 domain-containing protein [Paenibacillus sp. YPG26]USB32190.1 DUF1361 domain-containing protein [Paenibacillus sp. YPG26]
MLGRLNEVNITNKLGMLLLLFAASVLCLMLGSYLRTHTGRDIYTFLYWNMFLAWIPAGLALLLDWIYVYIQRKSVTRIILFVVIGTQWLLFYPNSAYLITDQLHPFAKFQMENGVRSWHGIEFWYHILLFFSVAVIGVLLGIYSLFSVQELVRRSLGRTKSWIFAVVTLALTSFGIYLGRFIRWNSWDAINSPWQVMEQVVSMFADAEELGRMIPFTGMIMTILLFSYLIVYGFSKMRQ